MSDLPESIGRYQVRRELGRGMMGVVYLAQDPDLGRDVALKVIQLPLGATGTDREGYEQRFFAEAQSAARLSHPGIVIVHDVQRDEKSGALFMALQLLPGRTLESLLKEMGRLDWRDALHIARRVAQALHHAHLEGVIHRDIKPANIMILPSGEPKIMDFGIAKLEARSLTATGRLVGTPIYMSPEQALARPVDGRSDIFSLGSVLYEMLTGSPAFDGETVTKILFRLMTSTPDPPSTLVPAIPPAVDNILRRCLARDPVDRYRDAQTLAEDISGILGVGTDGGRGLFSAGAERPIDTVAAAPPSPDHWAVPATLALGTRPRKSGETKQAVMTTAGFALVLGLGGWLGSRFGLPGSGGDSGARPSSNPAVTPPSRAVTGVPTEPSTPPVRAERRAELFIDFEHSLKAGRFRVFVDDRRVVDQPFGERSPTKPQGLVPIDGGLTGLIEVKPGLRSLRVEVSWDNNVKSERSQTFFSPGGKMRLKAKLGGLRKNLSLEWK